MMGKARTVVWFLAALVVTVLMAGYWVWTTGQKAQTVRYGKVNGIMYAQDKPSAVIDQRVVYEGDTLHGIKVVKIHKDGVEFEKGSKRWLQKVQEQPGRIWPKIEIQE